MNFLHVDDTYCSEPRSNDGTGFLLALLVHPRNMNSRPSVLNVSDDENVSDSPDFGVVESLVEYNVKPGEISQGAVWTEEVLQLSYQLFVRTHQKHSPLW